MKLVFRLTHDSHNWHKDFESYRDLREDLKSRAYKEDFTVEIYEVTETLKETFKPIFQR